MQKGSSTEVVGILSLSLILTSGLAIAATLPDLLKHFSNYSEASVQTLITAPAIPVMIMVALTPFISKFINERTSIILGLIIAGTAGIIPVFFSSYSMILISRIFLGVGFGLINTRAVSIIGRRYRGEVRAKLLGYRLSAETLGEMTMTFVAGQLLIFGWHQSFLIYSLPFAILIIYLVFVPNTHSECESIAPLPQHRKMSVKQTIFVLVNAVFIGFLISATVSNSINIPVYITALGVGSASGSITNILTLAVFSGFLSGIVFGKVFSMLKARFLPYYLLLGAMGFLCIALTNNVYLIGLGVMTCAFTIIGGVSCVFTTVSEHVPSGSLNTANAIILIGCNIGVFSAPYITALINVFSQHLATVFIIYSVLFFTIAIYISVLKKTRKQELLIE